ncbi:hypothetical protein LUT68_004309 [Escherichia coli]|nr:hypothetical protein [Escherichia coli]EIQ2013030.1 hypothetical protein [Escherichia coli]EJH1097104.1 hypothetical protein [Escherichia coli]
MNYSTTLSGCAITLHADLTARLVLLVRARDVPVTQNTPYAPVQHHSGRIASRQPSRYPPGPPAFFRRPPDNNGIRLCASASYCDLHCWQKSRVTLREQ